MTLEALRKDMVAAMKAKDKTTKEAVSSLVSAVKKAAIDEGCRDDVPEALVDRVILKEMKTVKEQLDTCPESRDDLRAELCSDGADIFGKQLTGTSAKKDFAVDESLFDTEESKAGWDTIVDLINTATADRNNVSGYSDVEGAAVQSVLNGSVSTESALEDLQKEWTSGKY